MIKEGPNKYQLLIADILFLKKNKTGLKKKGEPEKTKDGLLVISSVRKTNPNIAILALTDGNGGLEQEVKDSGAHGYYSKRYAKSNDTSLIKLGEMLKDILKERLNELNPAETIPKETYQDDPKLAAIIETIGVETVASLTTQLLQKKCTIKPHFIRAGLSGAAMLRLDCDLEVPKGSIADKRTIILKVSKDGGMLISELHKHNDIKLFPPNLFIPFLYNNIVDHNYWYAIGAQYQENTKTFIDWLLSKEKIKIDDIKKTLGILFLGEGLTSVYSNTLTVPDKRPNTVFWEYLKGSRQSRILQACEEFSTLAEAKSPTKLFDRKLIEKYLKFSKCIVDLNETDIGSGTTFCRSHGDLHSRNILIDQNGIPRLIDPANIDVMHWASDIARLSVDLIVSGLDNGDESHDWNKMPDWCILSSSFIRGNAIPDTDEGSANYKVLTTLKWLREKLPEIHDIKDKKLKPEWEFRLALAVEFMRASYRYQELPTPKRVLGLISACIALRETSIAFHEFKRD